MKKVVLLFVLLMCFLCKTYAQAPDWVWAKSIGSNNYEIATTFAVDALGNVYVCGMFYDSTLIIGSYTLTNSSPLTEEIFLAKFDVNGNVLWARSAAGADDDEVTAMSVDASGNIYLTGGFYSSVIDFGNTSLTLLEDNDIFVVKYNTNGNTVWAKNIRSTNGSAYSSSIAVNTSGYIYIAGWFFYPTYVGTYTLTSSGSLDAFVVKYNSNGSIVWAKSFGGTWEDQVRSISADASDNVYLTGDYNSQTISLGGYSLTNIGSWPSSDIFLYKLNSTGNVLWARGFGGNYSESPQSVTTDTQGNVFITGCFWSNTISFGSDVLTNLSMGNCFHVFLVKYSANGSPLWARGPSDNNDTGVSIATDALGNCYMTGTFESSQISFDSYTLENSINGLTDIFLVKYNLAGSVLWAKSIGGDDDDEVSGVAVSSSGSIYIAGYFESPLFNVGTIALQNSLNYGITPDIFIAKSENGTDITEPSDSRVFSVFPNPADNFVYITAPEIKSIEITNSEGIIINKIYDTGKEVKVNIEDLPGGVYVVKLITDNEVLSQRFIKQ